MGNTLGQALIYKNLVSWLDTKPGMNFLVRFEVYFEEVLKGENLSTQHDELGKALKAKLVLSRIYSIPKEGYPDDSTQELKDLFDSYRTAGKDLNKSGVTENSLRILS
jgi:hypothetical protein